MKTEHGARTKYSFVILSFNSERTLSRCLQSIVESLISTNSYASSEVFVVENGSKDKSKDILEQWSKKHPELIVPLIMDTNTGTTFSRNQALSRCTGDYIVILDSDAYISAAALAGLSKELQTSPDVGLVCPKLFYGDGRFQISVDKIPTLWHKMMRFLFLNKMQKNVDHQHLKTQDVDYAISACWMLSKEAVNRVPKFDENIFYSPEDVDYCMQLWISGLKVRYVPRYHVTHDAQELSRGFKFKGFHSKHLAGLFYLFRKYGYFFSPPYKKMNRRT